MHQFWASAKEMQMLRTLLFSVAAQKYPERTKGRVFLPSFVNEVDLLIAREVKYKLVFGRQRKTFWTQISNLETNSLRSKRFRGVGEHKQTVATQAKSKVLLQLVVAGHSTK